MKIKPTRHKDENTFKFQSFAERIENINVDIFHRVAHPNEVDSDDLDCIFHQTIQKWNVLNLTESYDAFRKEVYGVITLPQLIHKKDHVVEVLIKYLKHRNPLSLQPLLELIVALAKDLRKDFCPYYSTFFNQLIDLLQTKDTDQLEWVFTCLAYLFKFLWRYLIKDIDTVFVSLLPLLSDSKPAYISNFAAESFAFVARKVKDRASFLSLILKTVQTKEDGISGCGKLLFDVVRGIGQKFHSCAKSTLTFYFESLLESNVPQRVLFLVLEQLISQMVLHIHPKHTEIFWTTIISTLDKSVVQLQNCPTSKNAEIVVFLLKLLNKTITHKHGRFLCCPQVVVKEYLNLISIDLPLIPLLELADIGSLLLNSPEIQLEQEFASSLIKKTLNVDNKEVILDFIDSMTSYSQFEALILPEFLKYFGESADQTAFGILGKLLLQKSPLAQTGTGLSKWTQYPLEFSGDTMVVVDFILNYVIIEEIQCLDFDNFILSTIVIPHIIQDSKPMFCVLKLNIEVIINDIIALNETSRKETHKLWFLLTCAVECAVHLSDGELMCDLVKDFKLLPILLSFVHQKDFTLPILKVVDLIVTHCATTDLISMENLKRIDEEILSFFSSPFHQIRLLTSHIYTIFEPIIQTSNIAFKTFTLCYTIESIEPLVHTYRDQVQHFQKLSYDSPQSVVCKNTEFNTVPLRYCLGALYMNFQLLWDPIIEIIVSYARGMPVPQFWQIFVTELKLVVEHLKLDQNLIQTHFETRLQCIYQLHADFVGLTDKPDYANYRNLLWKAMALFPDIAETKSRDLSTMLLNFIDNDYRKSSEQDSYIWNIKQSPEDEPEEKEEKEDENSEIKKKLTKTVKSSGKSNLKTLQSHLNLFTKFRAPKSMHREPELYKLYLDLLSHRSSEIQKTALDCLITYKFKYLTPYQLHLYGLIDDKKFKTELALFRIDKETSVVQPDHRPDLIPIVLRIVHSKMVAKTGMRTGGKSSGQLRRGLVLRFLAGCHDTELMQFVKMAFKYYAKYIEIDQPDNLKSLNITPKSKLVNLDSTNILRKSINNDLELRNIESQSRNNCDQAIKINPEVMIKKILVDIDLEKFIPPKRLQSTLNLLLVILEQFGGLMGDELLSYLLKILFVVGATTLGAFTLKDQLHLGYLTSLKQIRTTCQTILGRFFGRFDQYPWSNPEINCVFELFVWPYLDKLSIEGIHSPTALHKLFYQWTLNPRYFPLLVKHEQNNPNQFVLKHLIQLLQGNKIHPSVTHTILESLEKLLSLKLEENDKKLEVTPTVPLAENILNRLKLVEELNFGSCILLPFVPQILERFKKKLANKNKGVNQRELFILSRISELVWEPQMCHTVLNLTLPVVVRKASGSVSDESIFQLVTTVFNLVKNVEQPATHLRKIAPLFCEVNSNQTRKLLIELLKLITDKYEGESFNKLSQIAELVKELNAFDKKWLDQPDFTRRHSAFKQINVLIDNDAIDIELGAILLYNCFYFIRNENDLAIRESSNLCLRTLVPYLCHKYQSNPVDKEYIINDILFQMIRKGFKSKNDHFRTESISLLGHMARECSDCHIVLRDLSKFSNKIDLEVDFFENLLHLQLYRQTRALNKFNQIAKSLIIGLNSRTITQFVLPLVSSYLLKEKYNSKNSLIDAAIEGVKIICQMLPWHQYESILKYYLGQLRFKLEFQKQLVRLTVAILDAYHFDLSKAQLEKNVEITDTIGKSMDPKTSNSNMEILKNDSNTKDSNKMTDSYNSKIGGSNINKTKMYDSEIGDCEKESKIDATTKDESGSDSELDKEDDDTEKEIDEILDNDSEKDILEVEEPEGIIEIPATERQTVLCPSAAKRVIFSIKTQLLPQLNKAMAEMTSHEGAAKVNRKRTGVEREEDELQKVPISLAVVKLLQRLPTYILERNLPGVFMKLCTFLKSPLDSVRRVTRETLQKIMTTLGPKYLSLLISEMSSLLSRGFQVHVLVYTTHSILTTLRDQFQPLDIDKCLLTILELCKTDLFGALSDEREVAKIVSKTSEAKSSKSYDTFQILATYITEKCLMDLLLPLKNVLSSTHSFKLVNKAQMSLRRIVLGLVDNKFIPIEALLVFAYGTSSESIPQFISTQTAPKLSEAELEKKSREKEDCFIIPKPKVYRTGFRLNVVRTSKNTNAHLLVEFGLSLCFFILKRDKIGHDNFEQYVDPFVVIFKNCLSSRHVKMCTLTIQCLSWVIKYELPSMKDNIKEITVSMFELLHKYASAGLSKGENFDLVVAAFKAMAILVRDAKYYTIDTDQLKALLLYAEQDLHDHDRQATAFALLKAILSRKFIIPEIHEVMDKVAELSITSEMPHVRLQCRQVFHQFLMDYPLGKKLDDHLDFYMSQLKYEMKPGRESALEMIYGVVSAFPLTVLQKQAGKMFVNLGVRLINDESPDCRKMIAKCLQLILERLPKKDRDLLFDILKSWFKDKKISHRRLAAQLCGFIINVEKQKFNSRLNDLVPLIKLQFSPNDDLPGKYVRLPKLHIQSNDDETDENAKPKDHQLFQILQMLLKLSEKCPKFLERVADIEAIAQHAQTLLGYPHEWVRISSAKFLGHVLSVLDVEHLAQLLVTKTEEPGYLYADPVNSVKSLTLDLCAQLIPGSIKPEFAEQVIKNLVFLARVLEKLPIGKGEFDDTLINLFWLTKRMRKIVNREIVEDPKSTILRTEVFKWIAAITTKIETDKLLQVFHHLLAPLVREMQTTDESNAPLRQLSREVGGLLKRRVGAELYIETMSKLQMQLNVRRAERKRERVQLAVTNPDIAARKKIKLQVKKKDAKKRKMANMKGKKFAKKKRKTVEVEDDI